MKTKIMILGLGLVCFGNIMFPIQGSCNTDADENATPFVTSEAEALNGKVMCGHYSHVVRGGTTYDNSKYVMELGPAKNSDGTDRALVLWKNWSDGSTRVGTGEGCVLESDTLTCEVEVMKVAIPLDQTPKTHVYGQNKFFNYTAKITVPTFFGLSHETYDGTCDTSIRIE
jgi:hypothetical protein